MFPVSTNLGGTSSAVPDTCKTPAPPPVNQVPMAYPNQALLMTASPATCSLKVSIMGGKVVTKKTEIPTTMGDEAGSLGGVVSGTVKGPAKFLTTSLKVKVEGQPVAFQTCVVGHNGSSPNAPAGIHDSPSQAKVMVGA